MTSLLARLDDLAAPLIEQITKHVGVTDYHAKVGVGALGVGLGAIALWRVCGDSRYNLPPGPKPLPIIGNLHNLGQNPKHFEVFTDLAKKYGGIVTIYFGPYRTILLNSADTVRDAYIRDGLAFADRQPFASLDILTNGGKDIIGAPFGPRLQQQRKLALAALRKYASGESLEHHVTSAFQALCDEVDEKGQFTPLNMGYLVAYNILATMCFGRKFGFNDPFMKEMMDIQLDLETSTNSPTFFFYILPIMKHFPSRVMRNMRKLSLTFNKFLQDCLTTHLETYNPDKLTDFTYHVIHEWKEAEKDENEKSKMKLLDQEHFKFVLFDIFFAGTDTTRITLTWVWQYLAAYPEIQLKAQQEIDENIGDGKVKVNCREQLPYVDAVLHEVMRIMPVAPTGVPRRVMENTKLKGFDIPKGTMIINNTWAIHHDERVWEDPYAFKPERWLDDNGQYVFQQNGFLPFSVGRRSCIGESFAMLELHMLTTMILQRYTLKPAPGRRINLNAVDGLVVRAPDQEIFVDRRK